MPQILTEYTLPNRSTIRETLSLGDFDPPARKKSSSGAKQNIKDSHFCGNIRRQFPSPVMSNVPLQKHRQNLRVGRKKLVFVLHLQLGIIVFQQKHILLLTCTYTMIIKFVISIPVSFRSSRQIRRIGVKFWITLKLTVISNDIEITNFLPYCIENAQSVFTPNNCRKLDVVEHFGVLPSAGCITKANRYPIRTTVTQSKRHQFTISGKRYAS